MSKIRDQLQLEAAAEHFFIIFPFFIIFHSAVSSKLSSVGGGGDTVRNELDKINRNSTFQNAN